MSNTDLDPAARRSDYGLFAEPVFTSALAYRAPWWLPGGHLQTLYAALAARRPRVLFSRERWATPDGDFVDADWLAAPALGDPAAASSRTPLVALFHGLEGCSGSHYARALMHAVAQCGWSGVVVHFRGCSGAANRLPRAYHSGDTVEMDWMLRKLRSAHDGPLYAVGVSLGGNVLLKWLGEHGPEAASLVERAAAVCAPVDLAACGNALGEGFNLVYTRAFLRTLKRKSLAKLAEHPALYDAARVRRARTLREFDDVVTAPLHGFRNADDYWARASSKPWLPRITVPTLLVNARNDPFVPEASLPGPAQVSAAVVREFPSAGGHVAFVSGPFPGGLTWLPQRLLRFFAQH